MLFRSVRWRADSADNREYTEALDNLRGQIDQIDEEVFDLLARRMRLADRIGEVKKANDVAILQGGRWSDIVDKAVQQAAKLSLSEEFVKTVLEAIHLESINRQTEIMNKD